MSEAERIWQGSEAADAWDCTAAARRIYLASVDAILFQLATVSSSMRILDVGAGTGDTTLQAARLVAPGGHVCGIDVALPMVQALIQNSIHAGLANVSAAVMDARAVGLLAASFDIAIARHSVTLISQPTEALKEIRRVLRPGGRLVASGWSELERNPILESPIEVMKDLGFPMPPTTLPTVAAGLNDPHSLESALISAGFGGVAVHRVPMVILSAPTATSAIPEVHGAPSVAITLGTLPPALQEEGLIRLTERWRQYEAQDGFQLPGESLVVVGHT